MKQYLLLTSALVAISGVAEAACIQTPTCGAMGYDSTIACEGGIKCPFGNAWNCTLANEIAQLKITIEKLEQTAQEEALAKCKIGDILYHDLTCNTNMLASKTPIGVVFDVANGLAIAKDEFTNLAWGYVGEDVSGVQNSSSTTTSMADWQGFNNTKAMYEADKSGVNYPAIKKVLTYSTTGTSQGQWYLPAAGELKAISDNKDALNTTLSKIGGTQMSGNYWSSSEQNSGSSYYIGIGNNSSKTGRKIAKNKAKPVINFVSKNKVDVAYVSSNETACGLGSILYSDKKCYAGSTPSGKTPIGIVFDASRRTAIALESSPSIIRWGSTRHDVPGLTNIEDVAKAKQDYNGKANTAAIKAYANSIGYGYPAAEYAYEYKTTGTNAGEWYLPALGELNTVYNNKDYMNYALSLVGKKDIPTDYHWSSSECSHGNAWWLNFDNDNVNYYNKDYSLYVRPVLAF